MKFAIVNGEYERELFTPVLGPVDPAKRELIRKNRQYLFYFINQDPNLGQRIYHRPSSQFSDYLESLGVKLPTFSETEEGFNWYGRLENLELERKLNSKIFSYEFLRDRGELPADLFFVDSAEEIKKILQSHGQKRWILKSPFMCGGVDVKLLEKLEDIPEKLHHRHILEPYLQRKLDFAVHYDPQTKQTLPYVSLIQANGGYRGGRIYANQENLYRDLKDDHFFPAFQNAMEKVSRYLEDLKKFPLTQPVTIDGFLYLNDHGVIQDYPMCEINYRISMGTFNQSLKRFVPDDGVGEFIVFPTKSDVDWTKSFPYSLQEKTGIIKVNDTDSANAYLLLCGKNRQMVKRMNLLLLQDIS